jgi:hypothetical protein
MGKNVRTIRRYLNPTEQLKLRVIAKMCEAVEVDPKHFDPKWKGPQSGGNDVQISARISRAAANGFTLMSRQYGVSKKQIIELAPVMFSVIAERALNRSERMTNERKKLDDLASTLGLQDRFQIDPVRDYEQWQYQANIALAAEAGKVFGFGYEEAPYSENLFGDELIELSESEQDKWPRDSILGQCPDSRGFHHVNELTAELTGDDDGLAAAIAEGGIDLSKMEEHLWEPENKVDRIRWLKHEANISTIREQKKLEALDRKIGALLGKKTQSMLSVSQDGRGSK